MTLENSSAMELQDSVTPPNPIQVLTREGHSRLASILRELVANLPHEFPTPDSGSRSPNEGNVVFTPFRPPPLDQGTWMDRARQVAVAAAVLRREAPNAARDWLDERCGLRFDESQVERAALTLDSQIRGWRRRRLPRHFWLFVLTWRERISQNSGSECLPATCLVAVDQHGYRMVADFTLGAASTPNWPEIFRALDQRGPIAGLPTAVCITSSRGDFECQSATDAPGIPRRSDGFGRKLGPALIRRASYFILGQISGSWSGLDTLRREFAPRAPDALVLGLLVGTGNAFGSQPRLSRRSSHPSCHEGPTPLVRDD